MKLKCLTFEFDNFDVHTIDRRFVDFLSVGGIEAESVRFLDGESGTIEFAGSVAAEISCKANTVHRNENAGGREYYPFRWLSCGNVSHVSFETEGDDKVYRYPVRWSDHPSVNSFQKSFISEHGNMYIVIDKDRGVEDFFNMERINSPEYRAGEQVIKV